MVNPSLKLSQAEVLISEAIHAEVDHGAPLIDLCLYCNKTLIFEPYIMLPFYNSTLKFHRSCAFDLLSYFSVELLDTPEELKYPYDLIQARIMVDNNMLANIDTYSVIGRQLGNNIKQKVGNRQVVEGILVSIDSAYQNLSQIGIIAQAKVINTCAFCGKGRSIVLPPQAFHLWKETDELPANEHFAREEGLLITNDRKHIFHKSCLNEVLTGLQRCTK